jgi:hypothetical protein
VKLAWVFAILLAIPAFAQAQTQYGTRVGQVQTAYLEDVPAAVASAVDISDRFREIVQSAHSLGAPQLAIAPVPAGQGPRAEFETWVSQLSRDYAESVVTGITGIERDAGKATVHRFVRDNFRKVYLTYTMTFESIPGTQTFRVAFSDAAIPFPVPQILRDGETIALDLAVDSRTGRRMVDYIRVGTGILKPRREVARNVYAEDAELTITQPRLRINGVEKESASLPAVSAPVVSIDIPGQGRFSLSLKPRSDLGFQMAGEVAENSLVFSYGGNTFRIDCADRIATGSGTYNVYARKDLDE